MYHTHLQGTHYEAGRQWGAALVDRGNFILDGVPFPISEERRTFSQACVPIYREYYPEILQEIQGLADGQHCHAEELQAVLFSMYAMPPAPNCSCFAVSNGKDILLGRNSDFLPALERRNMNVICRCTDGTYHFTGNTTAFVEMEDGVNEHGLAIGMTSVCPMRVKCGFNAGILLRFCLETCKDAREVVSLVRGLPISSAQTLTVADRKGNIAVIECSAERMEVVEPSAGQYFVCATNRFHDPAMTPYSGGADDDWFAEVRYATLLQALGNSGGAFGLESAQELLAGKRGFLCQYDRKTGRDTVWSVVYDLKHHAIYRAEGNPGRYPFENDQSFSFHKD